MSSTAVMMLNYVLHVTESDSLSFGIVLVIRRCESEVQRPVP